MPAKSYTVNIANESAAALSDLTTAVADAIQGYEEMLNRAEDDLKPVVERLYKLHSEHAAQLYTFMNERGGEPGNAGSIMGTVQAAVATARSWFGMLDASALNTIIEGERRLIATYGEAADAFSDEPELLETVTAQRAALQEMVREIDPRDPG